MTNYSSVPAPFESQQIFKDIKSLLQENVIVFT